MKIALPGQIAIDALRPNVAGLLHAVSTQFDCPATWSRSSLHTPGADDVFVAAPRSRTDGTDEFREKTGNAAYPDLTADVWLDEHRWTYTDLSGLSQGNRQGNIAVRAGLNINFGVHKGVPLSDVDSDGKSWLCWADEYQLHGGSICFRLSTLAGMVWLRGADQSGAGFMRGIANEAVPPRHLGPKVIQLAEWNFSSTITGPPFYVKTPWAGLGATDASGRQWRVMSDELVVGASLRLQVVGHYNDRLLTRQRHVISTPYDIVWQMDDQVVPFGIS